MPEEDLEFRWKVKRFTFGNIAGFIGESSPHQICYKLLHSVKIGGKNSHHSNVDELLESVSGDFFQRHVCQPPVGHMKSVKKSKENTNTSSQSLRKVSVKTRESWQWCVHGLLTVGPRLLLPWRQAECPCCTGTCAGCSGRWLDS